MKFTGMQEISMQDYPGQIATIVWTQGCNMNCWWCSNPQMIPTFKIQNTISERKLFKFLKNKNKSLKWVDALVICGGEPTIQKDLYKFLCRFKKKFPTLKVKLDTNGTNPNLLKKLIEQKLVDYIAMDVKPALFSDLDYFLSTIYVKKFIEQNDGEFRWTLYPGSMENKNHFKIGFCGTKAPLYLQKFSRKMKLNRDGHQIAYTDEEIKEFQKELEKTYKGEIKIRG